MFFRKILLFISEELWYIYLAFYLPDLLAYFFLPEAKRCLEVSVLILVLEHFYDDAVYFFPT